MGEVKSQDILGFGVVWGGLGWAEWVGWCGGMWGYVGRALYAVKMRNLPLWAARGGDCAGAGYYSLITAPCQALFYFKDVQ